MGYVYKRSVGDAVEFSWRGHDKKLIFKHLFTWRHYCTLVRKGLVDEQDWQLWPYSTIDKMLGYGDSRKPDHKDSALRRRWAAGATEALLRAGGKLIRVELLAFRIAAIDKWGEAAVAALDEEATGG